MVDIIKNKKDWAVYIKAYKAEQKTGAKKLFSNPHKSGIAAAKKAEKAIGVSNPKSLKSVRQTQRIRQEIERNANKSKREVNRALSFLSKRGSEKAMKAKKKK